MIVNADLRANEVLKRVRGIEYPWVAEVGVYEGEMSRRLLYRMNLHWFGVDAWGTYVSESYEASNDPMATMTPEEWARVKHKAIENVHWASDRVRLFHGTSEEASKEMPGEQFDVVFLDAAHDYLNVVQDIGHWWDRVAEGGYLGGHDWRTDKDFGVIDAVQEFAEEHNKEIELGENYCWFIKK